MLVVPIHTASLLGSLDIHNDPNPTVLFHSGNPKDPKFSGNLGWDQMGEETPHLMRGHRRRDADAEE